VSAFAVDRILVCSSILFKQLLGVLHRDKLVVTSMNKHYRDTAFGTASYWVMGLKIHAVSRLINSLIYHRPHHLEELCRHAHLSYQLQCDLPELSEA